MLHRDDYIKMLEKRAAVAQTGKEYADRASHWGRVGGTAGALAGLGAGTYHGLRHGSPTSVVAGAAGGALLGNVAGRLTHGAAKGHEFDAMQKRASDFDGGKAGPTFDHDVNSDEVANAEHRKNLSDNRETLGGLFKNMGEAQKVETRFANKWFPSDKYEKDTHSPLIKVAMETLSQSERFRGYPAHYKAAAIRSFGEELEKIANGAMLAAQMIPQALGGAIGYNYGKQQAERGEPYGFGVPQVGSLFLPGGAGYQIGRGIAHGQHKKPEPAAK